MHWRSIHSWSITRSDRWTWPRGKFQQRSPNDARLLRLCRINKRADNRTNQKSIGTSVNWTISSDRKRSIIRSRCRHVCPRAEDELFDLVCSRTNGFVNSIINVQWFPRRKSIPIFPCSNLSTSEKSHPNERRRLAFDTVISLRTLNGISLQTWIKTWSITKYKTWWQKSPDKPSLIRFVDRSVVDVSVTRLFSFKMSHWWTTRRRISIERSNRKWFEILLETRLTMSIILNGIKSTMFNTMPLRSTLKTNSSIRCVSIDWSTNTSNRTVLLSTWTISPDS